MGIEQIDGSSIWHAPDHNWVIRVPIADLEQRIRSPKVVIYAGGSEKRRDVVAHLFPQAQVINYPGGDEEETADVRHVAQGKIRFVELSLSTSATVVDQIGGPLGIVAADTRTLTPLLNPDGRVRWVSRGKPKDHGQVFTRFIEMMQVEVLGYDPVYAVQAATVYKDMDSGICLEGEALVSVTIDRRTARQLATSAGFGMYLTEFNRFYQSPPYRDNGYRPIAVTDLSAGLSLPVLFRLGAVSAIDGVTLDQPTFTETFRRSMYHVAVGINPQVLHSVEPTVAARMNSWPWLNQVTEFCIKGSPYG